MQQQKGVKMKKQTPVSKVIESDNPKYELGLWGRLEDDTYVKFLKSKQWKSSRLDEPRLTKINTQYWVRDIETGDEFWVDEENVAFAIENKDDVFIMPFVIIEIPEFTRDGVETIAYDTIEQRFQIYNEETDSTYVLYELTSGNIVEEEFLKGI
jgi:hypothetical protein